MPATLQELQKFIGAFCGWPSTFSFSYYLSFLQRINETTEGAVEFLGRVRASEAAEAKKAIFRLRGAQAWNKYITDFFVRVDWTYVGDDMVKLSTWPTLFSVATQISLKLGALPLSAPCRELYALLLSELLPIYFVKAANIRPAVTFLEQVLPDLVLRACGEAVDAPAIKVAHSGFTPWDYRYDACRGFLPKSAYGVNCLALIYNPEADSVPPLAHANQTRALDQIGQRARAISAQLEPDPVPALTRFLAAFRGWQRLRAPAIRRHALFLSAFHKNLEPAMDALQRASPRQLAAVRREIYTLRTELAWNVDISDFDVQVDWDYGGDEILKTPWSTLRPLIAKIAEKVNARRLDDRSREIFALLLSQLLPLYVVKAANIGPAITLITDYLPDFVLQACGEQRDFPASKAQPVSRDHRYDSCRGFLPISDGGTHYLALIYNENAEAVPPRELVRQREALSMLGERARARVGARTTVHFVWFGTGDPNRANTGFANAIADNLPHITVCYWCFEGKIPAFRLSLAPSVQVRSIDSLEEPIARRWGAPFLREVQAIFDFYARNKGFAPAKDLVTYLVLALYGGYFFDANCDTVDWAEFGEALRPRPVPAFLSLPGVLAFSPQDPRTMNEDDLIYPIGDDVQMFHETDMWAMYSPARSEALSKVVEQYVDRAAAYGFAKASGFNTFQRNARTQFSTGTQMEKRSLAGTLGGQAIFAGQYHLKNRQRHDPDTSNWSVTKTGPESYFVSALKLTKTHGGSW
ncbi:MAG: hypothetical protein JXB05_35465 [Myxococcaceae bacterium]|nr:hypothetical protein [Myxococcaceae bacterium]